MTTTITTRAVIVRGKAIFAECYNYPRVPFRSIGRKCFADCIRHARLVLEHQAAQAARVAAMPTEQKAERIADLRDRLALADYADSWQAVVSARASIMAELHALGAV